MAGSRGRAAVGLGASWKGLGAIPWRTRKRQDLSPVLLPGSAGTTLMPHQQDESGESNPGHHLSCKLEQALGAEGELWGTWAAARLGGLFRHRLLSLADITAEAYQVRTYAALLAPGPYLIDDYTAAAIRVERRIGAPEPSPKYARTRHLHPRTRQGLNRPVRHSPS